MLFIITGPSGCGKSTLVRRVMEKMKNVQFSVSHTTRKKRNAEKDGKDYYFVSKSEFEQMIKEEKLAEWVFLHGSYYGTSKREIEKKGAKGDLLLDIDIYGAQQIRPRLKKAVFIFILPPLFEELKRRLKKRGQEAADSVEKRLEVAKREIRSYPQFDYIIINDQLNQAVEELNAIILSMRCTLDSQQKEIVPILRSFSEEQ